jgi:hypothetical protein
MSQDVEAVIDKMATARIWKQGRKTLSDKLELKDK